MASVNIYEAKTTLSRLIARVEKGEEITISRNGKPVATLGPVRRAPATRIPGALRGRIEVSSDFDAIDDLEWYGE